MAVLVEAPAGHVWFQHEQCDLVHLVARVLAPSKTQQVQRPLCGMVKSGRVVKSVSLDRACHVCVKLIGGLPAADAKKKE